MEITDVERKITADILSAGRRALLAKDPGSRPHGRMLARLHRESRKALRIVPVEAMKSLELVVAEAPQGSYFETEAARILKTARMEENLFLNMSRDYTRMSSSGMTQP